MTQRDAKLSAKFVQEVAETYGRNLHQFLVKRLRAGEDAQDLAQEVYLRLLRLRRSDLVRQPAAYVYFLASQVVGEYRMREGKHPLVYDTDLLEVAADQADPGSVNELPDQEHARRELTRLLAKLNNAHRTVFLMRKRDGCSVQEIAAELGMSVPKVKRYIVEANAILESKLRSGER